MDRHEIAQVLEEIAALLEFQGANPFRARAFSTAARVLDEMDGAAIRLEPGHLEQLPGFGPRTAEVVRDLATTGESRLHRELSDATPPGLMELLALPGLGARKIMKLHGQLGITSLDDLEQALQEGQVATVSGFGQRTEQRLQEGIQFLRQSAQRRRRPEALVLAGRLLELLRGCPGVVRAAYAGELRRGMETVDGLDLVCAVEGAGADSVVSSFLQAVGGRGEPEGNTGAFARLPDGFQMRLRCVGEEAFAAALAFATGSPQHVSSLTGLADQHGLVLDESGLWENGKRVGFSDEDALYSLLGLPVLPPELREGCGELEAAVAGQLDGLLQESQLRGCFHCHTDYSDGKVSLRQMAEAARARGWRYLGLGDHSQAAAYAGGLRHDDVVRQHAEVDQWNHENGSDLWLFKGIEADILTDGRLDYDDEILSRFDYVVASVHSGFGMSQAEMTSRVLKSLENPHTTFLGHPTGRLLLLRAGYLIDLDAVIQAAAERGVGIEINANPYRLDLDWRYWRRARQLGVRTAINPDAHSIPELDYVDYGVTVARKGWLCAGDVVNTWELGEVQDYFHRAERS